MKPRNAMWGGLYPKLVDILLVPFALLMGTNYVIDAS